MASQELKHRPQSEQQPPQPTTAKQSQKPRTAEARRGLRSLALAVGVPISATLLDIFFFGSTRGLHNHKPFYSLPIWALHAACLAAASLLGLSAWLVWADGGFHRQPASLGLYLAQLALILGWYPVVFGAGAVRVGLVICGALFGCVVGCTRVSRNTNRVAGDLAWLCLGWAVLVSLVNLRLLYN